MSPRQETNQDPRASVPLKQHVEQWRRTWHEFNRALRSPEPFDQWHWMYQLTRSLLLYVYHESRLNVLVETRAWRPLVPAFAILLILFCGLAYFYSLRAMLIKRWCCDTSEDECQTCLWGHVQTVTVTYLILMILYHLLQATFCSPGVALHSDSTLRPKPQQQREQQGICPKPEIDKWSSLDARGGCCGLEPIFNAQAEYDRVALYESVGEQPNDAKKKAKSDTEYYPSPNPTYCDKCDTMRPPRCHHCSACNRCILQMDHHCPWVNNCIGYNNYRSFVLTLFFLVVACWYGFGLLVIPFYEFIQRQLGETWSLRDLSRVLLDVSPFWTLCRQVATEGMDLFVLLKIMVPLLFGVGLVITIFLAWHVFYIITGRTNLEHKVRLYQLEAQLLLQFKDGCRAGQRVQQQARLVNPFDQGWHKNMQQALGSNLFLIFLPIKVAPLPPFVPSSSKLKST